MSAVAAEVIVLNGGSSSGKSSIARCLQELLDEPWITLGVDELLGALAPSLVGDAPPRPGRTPLLRYGSHGAVVVDPAWWPVESAWYEGVAAMAHAGLGVIVEEVLLAGGTAQRRISGELPRVEVLWVGIRCDPAAASARETSRADRIGGMALSQAERVHEGVRYDVVVDTTDASPDQCARAVLAALQQR